VGEWNGGGSALNADRLNHLEQGIKSVTDAMVALGIPEDIEQAVPLSSSEITLGNNACVLVCTNGVVRLHCPQIYAAAIPAGSVHYVVGQIPASYVPVGSAGVHYSSGLSHVVVKPNGSIEIFRESAGTFTYSGELIWSAKTTN
jgi:hypothetical protein